MVVAAALAFTMVEGLSLPLEALASVATTTLLVERMASAVAVAPIVVLVVVALALVMAPEHSLAEHRVP